MQQSGDTYRDTMAATLDNQGTWYPPFFIKSQYANASYASGRRPPPGQKPIRGMTLSLMEKWIDIIDKYVDEPSLLILD